MANFASLPGTMRSARGSFSLFWRCFAIFFYFPPPVPSLLLLLWKLPLLKLLHYTVTRAHDEALLSDILNILVKQLLFPSQILKSATVSTLQEWDLPSSWLLKRNPRPRGFPKLSLSPFPFPNSFSASLLRLACHLAIMHALLSSNFSSLALFAWMEVLLFEELNDQVVEELETTNFNAFFPLGSPLLSPGLDPSHASHGPRE